MTILRIPDILDAISQIETGVHPDDVEVTRASNEWFASYKLMPQLQWNEMLKMKYGLGTAKLYPSGNKKQLRVAADWVTILFNYDDLFDDSTSDLTKDESASAKALKIMLSVLSDTDNFQPTPSLPMAEAFHSMWTRF